MKRSKKILVALGVIMMLVFVILFVKILKEKEPTISKLAHSKVKNVVYLLEDDEYIPFVVACTNDSGNALLVRAVALEQPLPIKNDPSCCKNCAIDHYLNEEYIKKLRQIKDDIVNSKTDPVCKRISLGGCENVMKQIDRKIRFDDECEEVTPGFYIKGDTKFKKVNLKGIGEGYVISE